MWRRIFGFGSVVMFLSLPFIVHAADNDHLKFEVYADKEHEYRWRLKQGDETLATAGQAYTEKASCKKSIEGVMKGVETDKDKFEVYEDRAMGYRWRLRASNGQLVAASSKGYKDKSACQKAVDMIKKEVPKAQVVEPK